VIDHSTNHGRCSSLSTRPYERLRIWRQPLSHPLATAQTKHVHQRSSMEPQQFRQPVQAFSLICGTTSPPARVSIYCKTLVTTGQGFPGRGGILWPFRPTAGPSKFFRFECPSPGRLPSCRRTLQLGRQQPTTSFQNVQRHETYNRRVCPRHGHPS